MQQGQFVFSQLKRHPLLTTFRRCVSRYPGKHKVKSLSCLDQYLCMAFAQLTYRESLRLSIWLLSVYPILIEIFIPQFQYTHTTCVVTQIK